MTSDSPIASFAWLRIQSMPRDSAKRSSGSSGVTNASRSASRSAPFALSASCSIARTVGGALRVAAGRRPGGERVHPAHGQRDLRAQQAEHVGHARAETSASGGS